jgi:hypothetical protein
MLDFSKGGSIVVIPLEFMVLLQHIGNGLCDFKKVRNKSLDEVDFTKE